MRHQKSGRKFGRSASHRKAMFRTMVTNLIEHERIKTTEAKAKELRGVVERTITVSLRLGDLLDKPKEKRTREEHMRVVHAMREVSKMVRTREMVHKVFEEIAPALKGRPGGLHPRDQARAARRRRRLHGAHRAREPQGRARSGGRRLAALDSAPFVGC